MSLIPNFNVALRIAIGTFALNALCQAYHLFVEPYQLYVAFSPNPFFILLLLFTQVVFHVKWLVDLWHREPVEKILERRSLAPRPAGRPGFPRYHSFDYEAAKFIMPEKETEQDAALMSKVEQTQMEYLPIYILGNLCLAGWSVAWFREKYAVCQILCTITILAQFYSLFFVFQSRRNRDFNQRDYLTNLIVKPRVAGALLLMLKTWGAVDNLPPPSLVLQICFGSVLLLLILASGPDPTLGFCVLFDLIALEFGDCRNMGWYSAFWKLAIVVTIVTLCDWFSAVSRRDGLKNQHVSSKMACGEKRNINLS